MRFTVIISEEGREDVDVDDVDVEPLRAGRASPGAAGGGQCLPPQALPPRCLCRDGQSGHWLQVLLSRSGSQSVLLFSLLIS